jgi:hypothetical protein
MHGIHQTDALFDPASSDQFLNRIGDVDKSPAIRNLKPEMLSQRFHEIGMSVSCHFCKLNRSQLFT